MNNILSLKTVGLSYASTNLSFAFALYFNISMFLLYHNPPLFSITRRTCPNVFLFGVQIPVDACPLFGSKRRSFLFVIDINGKRAFAGFPFLLPPTDEEPLECIAFDCVALFGGWDHTESTAQRRVRKSCRPHQTVEIRTLYRW